MQQKILIGGHRGFGVTDNENSYKYRNSSHAETIPENTLEAYKAGLAANFDFIEFDVVPAKDGLVCNHSARLADHMFPPPEGYTHTTQLTMAEISKHIVGHRRGPQDTTPDFKTVLWELKPLLKGEQYLVIEGKELQVSDSVHAPERARIFARNVYSAVAEAGMLDKVQFCTFDPVIINEWAACDSTIRLAMNFEGNETTALLMHEGGEHEILFTPENVIAYLERYPRLILQPPPYAFGEGFYGYEALEAADAWAKRTGNPFPDINLWAYREKPPSQFAGQWSRAIAACYQAPRLGILTDYTFELRAELGL